MYARAEERTGAGQRDRPEVADPPSQPRSQLLSQLQTQLPSQPELHDQSHEARCRRSRASSTPPVMFDDSFDERSELFGSPQPLAEESIARTSTLNIVLSCQGGSFASMHSTGAGGGSRRQEAGWGRVG